ncbi:MAG: hypothetical protein P4K86_12760 [Terracidiphilus sp.]|nr:hypothetical protein [Terracidiphilus sp.]MDR3775877.1 hypothetical protein [Terracidiphilus sp.]
MSTTPTGKYRLLEEILSFKGLSLQPVYSIHDVANLFKVTARAIQNRVALGQIQSRNLPGRAKFLSEDIEAFLAASKKKVANGK